MDDIFVNAMIEKSDRHEKRLDEQDEKLSKIPDYSDDFMQVRKSLDETKSALAVFKIPVPLLALLNEKLQANTTAQQQPQRIIHHHHFHWIAYVTVGLFIILCLVCSGWYMTGSKLDTYIENDTKYRYLKLESPAQLRHELQRADSLFMTDPDLRNKVLKTEENQRLQQKLNNFIQASHSKLEELKKDSTLLKRK